MVKITSDSDFTFWNFIYSMFENSTAVLNILLEVELDP